MKAKKINLPMFIIVFKGRLDARRKTFTKRNSKFHTGFTAAVESRFNEFCTRCCQHLILQTACERIRLNLCCQEYTRMRNLTVTDDTVEASRRYAERKHLEDEIISIYDSISAKISFTSQSIYRALKVYNSQLTAYYSGLNTGLDVDQNGMIEFSMENSPFTNLMSEWAEERKSVEVTIALVKGGEAS